MSKIKESHKSILKISLMFIISGSFLYYGFLGSLYRNDKKVELKQAITFEKNIQSDNNTSPLPISSLDKDQNEDVSLGWKRLLANYLRIVR